MPQTSFKANRLYFSLTQKHDGVYLAKVVADCLIRFGLHERVSYNYLSPPFSLIYSSALFDMHGQCYQLRQAC